MTRRFDLIAFDGDDTLWHNERSFRAARDAFRAVVASSGVLVSDEEIDARVNETEVRNIDYYGYGVSSFILSLIETAIALTGGRITGDGVRALIALAKQMMTEEIELFDGVRDAVVSLSASFPLMLITKGDLLHQTSKLDRSGLRDHFRYVEVVSHKTPAVYAAILSRYGVDPGRFLMIGNSLKSDVLPVVDAGGWAIHVPAEMTWVHEHAEASEAARRRYREIPSLAGLAAAIDRL